MATIKYCPNPKCDFEEENFEFDGCPKCGGNLMIRQVDENKTQTVGADTSRQHDSKVNIGAGGAVRGDITSNTITYDHSSNSVVNNVTNIIKEKSTAEKHEESVRRFRLRCRDLCHDGLLSKDGELELERLRTDLGLSSSESLAILSEEKRLSKKVCKSLEPEIAARLVQTRVYIEQNNINALRAELEDLRGWKKSYDVNELNQLYYQLYAILSPNQFVNEIEEHPEDNYWMFFWGSVAYLRQNRIQESGTFQGGLTTWNSEFPEQNGRILSSIKALMREEVLVAQKYFKDIHIGYSKDLEPLVRAIQSLLEMNWENESASLPPTGQFYYESLFKNCCDACRKQAEDNRQKSIDAQKKIDEERKREQCEMFQKQQEIAAVKAEADRVEKERRLEEERRKREEAEAEAAREKKQADEEERKRILAQLAAEKEERKRRRRLWLKRNTKWFVSGVFVVILIVASVSMYKSCQEKRQHEEAVADSIRQDSIVAANRQEQFDEKMSEFERLMNQPLSLDNARHTIVESRRILLQMIQMESEFPEIKGLSLQKIVNDYNKRVDAAIDTVRSAKNDPNCLIDKKELEGEINSIDRLHYKL